MSDSLAKSGNVTPVARHTHVTSKIAKQYVAYHDLDHGGAFAQNELVAVELRLFSENTSLADKKRLLFRLAHTPLIPAYQLLQKFYFEADHLRQWATLCLEECQMHVQLALMDQDDEETSTPDLTMSSSLGGGDGSRMRFWTIFTSREGVSFSNEWQSKLNSLIHQHFANKNGVVEKIDWHDHYLIITGLHRAEVAIDAILTPILKDAQEILRYHYFCTNVHYPTAEETQGYISGKI